MERIDVLDIRDEFHEDVGTCEHEVVGESFHKKEIQKVFESIKNKYGRDNSVAGIDVILIPEKGNKYDKNAVRVDALLSVKGEQTESTPLGYLAKEEAESFREAFPNQCLITHGEIDGHYWQCDNDKNFSVSINVPEEREWY